MTMFEQIIKDPVSSALGLGSGLALLVYFIRFVRRMYYSERRDTSLDLASQGLFENLRLENERMAKQMGVMSRHLEELARENNELNKKVSELSLSVKELVKLEQENNVLQQVIIDKDRIIIEKERVIEELSRSLTESLEVIKLRKTIRE